MEFSLFEKEKGGHFEKLLARLNQKLTENLHCQAQFSLS